MSTKLKSGTKRYIGDSVYAEFDGWGIKLTTENGLPSDPSNTIYLHDTIWEPINLFIKQCKGE